MADKDYQRPPRLGDWTVCQDKDTTKTAVRPSRIDSINQLNVLDWAIADYNNGKEQPYLYVPNRVYALDTVFLKPTLEGLMPIPENLDGNCYFDTVSQETVIVEGNSSHYCCSHLCKVRDGHCPSFLDTRSNPNCPLGREGGKVILKAIGKSGVVNKIDFRIKAKSAFEYLDIRITDWPRSHTYISGVAIKEDDDLGWPTDTGFSVRRIRYDDLGGNVFRIWALPGSYEGNPVMFGPAGTDAKLRVRFTLLGEYIPPAEQLKWEGNFPETKRTVEVSYVGAGRRGNHRA